MKEVVLARHGESEFSVRGLMNGDPGVSCPLTEAGIGQARELGRALRGTTIDLCVTTAFARTQQTAELALEGRDVPRLVVPELNDIHVGEYEGGPLETYLAWAREQTPLAVPAGGESRIDAAERYARGFRAVLERREGTILVVAHGLPVRYVLLAAGGERPAPVIERVPYAEPYRLSSADLERAVAFLASWRGKPAWKT